MSTDEAKAVLATSSEITVTNSRLFSITSSCIDVSDDYYWLDREVRAKPAVREAMAALDLVREKLRLSSLSGWVTQ
ncbi:hypothetical protein GOB93_21005 [Acetobacter musti]|uniref:Peptidase S9A N-terminal domain-containing protein n=1 Tax=Acetobacter musti TaxID=864732 RepID=A0ABX0JU41_9PROT|nr:hypothetical protein [Acetobacter musti]NHN87023.1 hypothetical protein [Acetobacter musti]